MPINLRTRLRSLGPVFESLQLRVRAGFAKFQSKLPDLWAGIRGWGKKIPGFCRRKILPFRNRLTLKPLVYKFFDFKNLGLSGLSLGLRLMIMFLSLTLTVWLVTGLLSWRESRKEVNKFFDSYQLLLAHQLSAVNWPGYLSADGQEVKNPFEALKEETGSDGSADKSALGFAVFDPQGRLIFSDGANGRLFPYDDQAAGFIDQKLPTGRKWRLVWVKTPDGRATVAVGQRLSYRHNAALELIENLLLPWLAGLVFLTGASIWMVRRELKPLKKIAGQLSARAPDDLSPLNTDGLPLEVAPLGLALNSVFVRLHNLLDRERAFVSDAAHELRTPLAALRVQTEVAQLSHDDPATLNEALAKLTLGIDRTARLVEQLLALSRLERAKTGNDLAALNWPGLIEEAIAQTETGKKMTINFVQEQAPRLKTGQPLLLGLMLRNLLDNARRYSPEGSTIDILLDGSYFSITNQATTLPDQYLKRLGERFFRPPGQEPSGSGLGLSIVTKVADLHGCSVTFQNTGANSFCVSLHLPDKA